MAFQLQVSNSLDQLAEHLCSSLQSVRQEVFQPNHIITQTEGMNNWLKLQMADQIGIAANCLYLKPNDIINKIYYLTVGDISQTLSTENLNWLLFQLLSEDDFIQKHPSVSGYYHHADPDKDVKRMALAEKVSDLFDQYQIYRTDMILEWNNSKEVGEKQWQQELWLRAKALIQNKFPDKTRIQHEIEAALTDPHVVEKLQLKMPRIYLFGISLITGYHLKIFQLLSQFIDIHFLLLNPAPAVYWIDDESEKQLAYLKKAGRINQEAFSLGNPLLTDWGKIIRNTFLMLFENEELINSYEEAGAVEPLRDSLLHKIQFAIFQNEAPGESTRFSSQDFLDGSVTLNSCYSPAREVETLYNYLVHLIDKRKENLSARDIVVMVSDIDLYASYIKAVFGNAPYPFPFTIADETYASSDSISNALQSLLGITEEHFTAEEVIRLLDISFIRDRFGINNLNRIREILDEANIRFGIDGNKEDDSIYVSWNYGLKRIMYGICMSGSPELGEGPESFYPLDRVEGNAALEVIGFVHFVRRLMDFVIERNQPKTIEDWVDYIERVLQTFIAGIEENTDEDYLLIVDRLENYNEVTELFSGKVSYEVFMHRFLATLTGATRNSAFVAGGITFCSLIPMRSIPFKVVALLGLNFDQFPRKENRLSFNLMEERKRKGDRNVKENDKHLFLETLLSAGSHLYISYIGQSIKDNSSIPPSTLIDELINYLESCAEDPGKVRKQLITQQPLHSFSKKYKEENPGLFSYLEKSKPFSIDLWQDHKVDIQLLDEVSVQELVGFFKNPVKGYYNHVLEIYYHEDDVTLRDTELFELDHLQKWKLKNELLPVNNESERSTLEYRLLKTGGLPLKNMAKIELEAAEAEVRTVRKLFLDLIGDEEAGSFNVDIELGPIRLSGSVTEIYGDKLVTVSWSKSENKYLLDAYIRYLALCASGVCIQLHFISCNKAKVFEAAGMSAPEATQRLTELIQLYLEGHTKMLAFDPGLPVGPGQIDMLDEAIFQKAVTKKYDNFSHSNSDPYTDKEFSNGFFNRDTIVEEYKLAANKLLVPLAELFPSYFE